ncbi:MAG: PH domain-containing protein [Phycisphaerae bacterium]|nr:PH domain-containing protein [Phycisphaerae bacterium]
MDGDLLQDPAPVIEAELSQDEKLLWSGKPRRGIRLRPIDAFLVPFSIVWAGFAVFWETMALSMLWAAGGEDAPSAFRLVFPLFGIPFVLMGLYLLVGRFWLDAARRARTYYGVTSRRVIIVSGILGRKVKSLNLRTITDLSLAEKSDGSGTITFGATFHPFAAFSSVGWPGMGETTPSFEMVENAKHVFELIAKAQQE